MARAKHKDATKRAPSQKVEPLSKTAAHFCAIFQIDNSHISGMITVQTQQQHRNLTEGAQPHHRKEYIMKTFYINTNDLDKLDAQIIDERTLEDAERFKNYLNADDFTYLCEAENLEQAKEAWAKEWNESVFDRIAESNHP